MSCFRSLAFALALACAMATSEDELALAKAIALSKADAAADLAGSGFGPAGAASSSSAAGAADASTAAASSTAAGLASTHVPLTAKDLAAQIRARAAIVKDNGEYIGLFELVVYAALRLRPVYACFGSGVVNILNLFAPWLLATINSLPPSGSDVRMPARFVGCVAGAGGKLISTTTTHGYPVMNHWVIGVPIENAVVDVVGGSALPAKPIQDANLAANFIGWLLRLTVTDGNCGIDTMAYFDGSPRTQESWDALRRELYAKMCAVADDPLWQDCFRACQESTERPEPATLKHEKEPSSWGAKWRKWVGSWLPKKFVASGPVDAEKGALSSSGAASGPVDAEKGALSSSRVASSLVARAAAKKQEDPAKEIAAALPESTLQRTFEAWLNAEAGDAVITRAAQSYEFFKELEKAWLKRFAPSRSIPNTLRKMNAASRLHRRGWLGRQYLEWRAKNPDSKQATVDFLQRVFRYSSPKAIPKKDKTWMRRCVELAQREAASGLEHSKSYKRTGSVAFLRRPDNTLLRSRPFYGRRWKCEDIKLQLWDWFVDIRSSVAASISPKFVLAMAKEIAASCLETMKKQRCFMPMPVIDANWLWRFKKEYRIVWRKPNAKYKIAFDKLKERCCATWLNIFRVHRFAWKVLGVTLKFCGIDEKPIHFNEAGSKNVSTLEIQGAPIVRLKTNHAASRERATVMTFVTDDEELASCPERIPLEVLFKAGSNKRTRGLKVPSGMNVSVAWGPKGSYRKEDIMRYLRRTLPAWTKEREAAKDYRILMLDVARSHIGDDLVDLAWSRGFLTLYHYGGITGVCQVNDTDLHGPWTKEFLHLEEQAFVARQSIASWDIGRDCQDVLNDVIETHMAVNHSLCAGGHKTTGLSIAPNDSEDPRDFLGREALVVWAAANMDDLRLQAFKEVDDALAAREKEGKPIDISLWRSVVQHPNDPGVMPEGFECEGELSPGERPWTEMDLASASAEKLEDSEEKALDAELFAGDGFGPAASSVVESSGPPALEIVAEAGDEPDDVQEARLQAQELAKLERLRALAKETNQIHALRQADKSIKGILGRQRSAKAKDKARENLVFSRAMRAKRDARREVLRKKREAALELRARAQKAKLDAADKKAHEKLAEAKEKELKDKLTATYMSTAHRITPHMCGSGKENGGGKAELKMRIELLERLKLRSPALPPALELAWTPLRDRYAKWLGNFFSKSVGKKVVDEVNEVVEKLGQSYRHPKLKGEDLKKLPVGDHNAFIKYLKQMRVKTSGEAEAETSCYI